MDVLGDVSHRNYTTRIHLEDLVVGDNNSLVYVTQLAPRLTPDLAPTPGYGLYWRLMVPVAAWFQVIDKDVNICCVYNYCCQPLVYPLVKLSLVAVSLVGLVTSSLALAGHTLAACSAHYPAYPGCWLGHPTPLLLAELSLMLTMSQVRNLASNKGYAKVREDFTIT